MRKRVAAGLTSTGIASGSIGGYQVGVNSSEKVVIIRPPLESIQLDEKPKKTKLEKQLEEAGIEVIYDDIVNLPDTE